MTEFHHTGDTVNDVGRKVVRALEDRGVKALNHAMGFPMEMVKFPGKIWVVSHKPVAVAAGHIGAPDLHVTADAVTWIGFLRQERNIVWAIFRRKVRLNGPLKLLLAFGKCFPA